MPKLPATLDEVLSPEWLTAALSERFPGIEVTHVTPGPVVSRLSTNARFTIECAGGLPDGLVPTLCAKGYFTDKGRPVTFLGAREVGFYRDVAEATGVRTLRSVYAEVDPETRHNVVITEDVIAAGGVFLDALSPYTPGSDSREPHAVRQAARRHVGQAAMGERRLARLAQCGQAGFRGVDDIRVNFDGPIGAGVPAEVNDPQRLIDAFEAVMAPGDSGVWAVLHGDAHVGNIFLDAEARPGLVDFQCVRRAHWAIDIGYHIASALETSDREKNERDLLAHYLEQLRANGVDAPGWDEAWNDYRKGIVFGLYMWAVTLLVDPEITTTLLQRLGAAAAMHDSFGAVGV